MGVASWQKCPEGKRDDMIWIYNLDTCSEAGKCMYICRYNRKPEETPGNNAPRRRFFLRENEQIYAKNFASGVKQIP